jgi:hypothetical protein
MAWPSSLSLSNDNQTSANPPIDKLYERIDTEMRGQPFIDRLCRMVKPGELERALEIVKSEHVARPYQGWSLGRVVQDLRKGIPQHWRDIERALKNKEVKNWFETWTSSDHVSARKRIYDCFCEKIYPLRADCETVMGDLSSFAGLIKMTYLQKDTAKHLVHKVPLRMWLLIPEAQRKLAQVLRGFKSSAEMSWEYCQDHQLSSETIYHSQSRKEDRPLELSSPQDKLG